MQPSTMLFESNPLVKVIPGLMIWTLIAFAITFFVLKRYAFGPIQKLIDERRERIRESVEEADRVREEARSLLEEHKALIGQARERRRVDPRRGAQDRRRPAAADARGDRGGPRAPARGDRASDRAGDGCRRSTSIKQAVADLSLEAAEKITRKSLDRRGPEAPDRRGARRDRLHRSWRRAAHSRRAAHLRERALRGGRGQGPARPVVREQLGDLAHAIGEVPELEAVLDEPRDRVAGEGRGARADPRRGRRARPQLHRCSSSRRAAPARSAASPRSSRRSSPWRRASSTSS